MEDQWLTLHQCTGTALPSQKAPLPPSKSHLTFEEAQTLLQFYFNKTSAKYNSNIGDQNTLGLGTYLPKIQCLELLYDNLMLRIQHLQHLTEQFKNVPKCEENDIRDQMCTILSESDLFMIQLKVALVSIKEENQEFINLHGKDLTESRIRTNLHLKLTKRIQKAVQLSQLTHSQFQSLLFERFDHKVRCVCPDVSDTFTQNLVKLDDVATSDFSQKIIFQDPQHHNESLAELESRCNDIRRIESSVMIMRKMFLELSEMIENQDCVINHIEASVLKTREYSESAFSDIESAKTLNSSKVFTKGNFSFSFLLLLFGIVLILSNSLREVHLWFFRE